MSFLHVRDVLRFPSGANDSDTVITGTHFNLTTLNYWNYTLYSNGTLSNGSRCYLAAQPYTPVTLLSNGTFINSTSCYNPVDGIGTRASIGIGIGVVFAICLVGVLMNIVKHGKLHLPAEKRFVPIGRRWQWYWSIFVIVTAFISLFTTIDIDRFRVIGLPIILSSFFWFLMQQGVMALVWEAVRHWGSWQERQFIDPDPFMLPDNDRRSKVEFFLPLFFYLWLWLNFFLIVPRNWGLIEQQRSPEQTAAKAAPAATDIRFKIAAIFLLLCWLTTVASLLHSIKHYKIRPAGLVNQISGYARAIPLRFLFFFPLSLIVVAYQALVSFSFPNSVLNAGGNFGAVYAGGYGPALAILAVQIVWGFRVPNEDLELKRQRRHRGDEMDRELGYTHKPAWWRRVKEASTQSDRPAMGGGRPTARGVGDNWGREGREDPAVEMAALPRTGSNATRRTSQTGLIDASRKPGAAVPYASKSTRRRSERAMSAAGDVLFPNAGAQASAAQARAARRAEIMQDGPAPPPYTEQADADRGRTTGAVGSERSTSTGTGASTRQPQQIRSMLDV